MTSQSEKEWMCSRCFKQYTLEEFFALRTAVCSCGARFHVDTWRLQETISVPATVAVLRCLDGADSFESYWVSTVCLELNHFGSWYETMVFTNQDDAQDVYVRRYVTQEEAEAGHKDIVVRLQTTGELP